MQYSLEQLIQRAPVVERLAKQQETAWENPQLQPYLYAMENLTVSEEEIDDAENRLAKFAPFIMKCFPETIPQKGLIESPLTHIPNMQKNKYFFIIGSKSR